MRFGAIFSFGVLFATAACGGGSNSSSSPNTPDAGVDDASVSPAGDDDSADAGAPDTAPDPHAVYPAAHPPIPVITNFGGRLITNAKIVTVTFAGMDTTIRDYLRDFDDKIGASAYWATAMDGYGIGPAQSGGSFELPDTLSNVTTADADLQTYLAAQVASGALPAPDSETIYLVYVPFAAKITMANPAGSSCADFGGYHGNGVMPIGDGGSQTFVYAVLDECYGPDIGATSQDIMDELTVTASHELAEVVTDPDVNSSAKPGYYMMYNDAWATTRLGGEVADLCETVASVREGNWAVTRIWNAKSAKASAAPCVPATKPVYYNAAPYTVAPSQKYTGASDNFGYVVAQKGKSADVEVDVFSTGPLPGPLTILAGKGKRTGGTFDPYSMQPITKGVTMTLSQTTATNGDKLTLHIALDATTVSGTYSFTIRSVLSATDYNTWPVLLYVP